MSGDDTALDALPWWEQEDEDFAPRDPWDKLPNEPLVAYSLFLMYRDMPKPRSLARAYALWRTSRGNPTDNNPAQKTLLPGYIGGWSSDYDWVARVVSWDIFREQSKREAERKIIDEGRKKIGENYVRMIELQTRNVLNALQDGKLTQNVNMALKDLLDRYGGESTKRVELDADMNMDINTDKTEVEVRHTFLDEEQAAEVAAMLREVGAYDAEE